MGVPFLLHGEIELRHQGKKGEVVETKRKINSNEGMLTPSFS